MKETGTFQTRVAGDHRNAGTALGGGAKHRTWMMVAAALATFVAIVAVAFAILASMLNVSAGIRDGTVGLSPRTTVTISVWNLGPSIIQANLTEATLDIDGKPGPARELQTQLVPLPNDIPLGLRSDYRVERTDGSPLMSFDGLYRLTLTSRSVLSEFVTGSAPDRSYTFSTLTSPKLRLPERVVPQNYQKPVELHWSEPVESFRVETVPALDVRTWVDPSREDVGYVDLVGAKPGTEYEVRVVDAVAATGAQLVAPAQLRVLTPAPPELIAAKVKLEDGDQVVIPWDRAIKGFDYDITPAVQSVASVGPSDPSISYILLQNPRQGQEYTIRIKGATATTGAPLSGTRELKVATPNPLKADKFLPEQPKWGVPLEGSSISISFSEPVKDRAATEASIKITPSVQGKFEWPAPNLVRFVPLGKLPGATDFMVQVAGGKGGVRGADGGYLDQSANFTFWTAPEKEIEVNLTQQKLTLWEGGKPVWSTLVSTGVAGAETPTGLFTVQYKMTATRMRGVNPSGLRYDLPDVPWVMPFQGDYTLHGAYWRDNYGYPQSNGCVSMPIPAAKYLYDQTPVGTPVRIHY